MATPKSSSDVKVLLLDPLHESSLTAFELAHFQVSECFEELTEGQLANKISDYHIICLKNRIITEEVLNSAHRLLAIGVFGDHASSVDVSAAQSMGIPVFTAPYQHQHSVAEFIIASIVLLSRKVSDQSRQIHDGIWNKASQGCHEVRNKTLGIVGYGNVGSQLGVLAEALSLRVIFYDNQSIMPIGRAEPMDTLSNLLEQSDFVSINISSTAENKNLFSKQEFEKMKPYSYLLNSSYGSAVDLDALAASIKAGHLAGAAIDVFPDNYSKVNCLKDIPNVILSDGLAPNTIECSTRIVQEVTRSIVQYMTFGSSVGSVNYPSIVAWPLKPGTRRIINVHRNVRGVLKEIDYILSSYNVGRQVLDTNGSIGYLIADIHADNVTAEINSHPITKEELIRKIMLLKYHIIKQEREKVSFTVVYIVMSDRDKLIDMGFEADKVDVALKATKNAGLQAAMDWLVNPPLESNDQLDDGDGEISADQATAQSLKCDDCGKLLRNSGAAETHAYKTQHVNFSESTTAIKPLTAEEKAQKVKELQELLKIKRAERELREKEEAKTKEKVRRKTGKEMSEIKEKMKMQEHEQAMKEKAREKAEEKAAKERIKALLEADKLERQRQAEERKLNNTQIPPNVAPSTPVAPVISTSGYTETRIQIRLPEGPPLTQKFDATAKMSAVYDFISKSRSISANFKLMTTFPRKVLDGPDKEKSLKELNLVPSAALVLQLSE